MSAREPSLSGAIGVVHPAVLQRRVHDLLLIGLAGLIAAALALAIIVAVPHATVANAALVLAGIVAALGVAALVASSRLEVTVTLLSLYLLLLYGPVKLGLGGGELAHGADDVLILAICVGAVMRLLTRREPVKLPPLGGWVLAFVATVLLEAFNPKTHGILKDLGGFRQELHFVPYFFFGYALIRSKRRFRQFFLIVGVCALANGIVASYQTGISPARVATWGPGYRELFQPTAGKGARVFESEGEAYARPTGLGSDSGFSGGLGLVALPLCLALLATGSFRERWPALVLALGALAGVVTSGGRTQLIGAGLSLAAFLLLASLGGRQVKRPLAAALLVLAIAIPLGTVFVTLVRKGTFARYTSLEKTPVTSIITHKSGGYTKIPQFLASYPFGKGLGTTGSVGGFGGSNKEQTAGTVQISSGETQYNFLANELGAPGLIVWIVLSLYTVVLVVRRLPAVHDSEMAIMLAASFAPFVALIFIGFTAPTLTSTALGPFFWFAIGIAAYWLAGSQPRAEQASVAGAR